jgi:channel protein (hemolysin III family)
MLRAAARSRAGTGPARQLAAGQAAGVGGGRYTIGAIIYAAKRSNPFPRVFCYHEVFHALVIVAPVCHFVMVTRLVVG